MTNNNFQSGHRERARERFLQSFSENYNMSDADLLELILFYSIPRKDVKPLAKQIIKDFGSFANLINSNLGELQTYKKLSQNSITLILLLKQSCKQLLLQNVSNQPIISNWSNLIDYCFMTLAHEKIEMVKILYINHKNRLIKDEIIQKGSINSAMIYPREIIKRNLELGTNSFIIIHNHPSGDYTPSEEDIVVTNQLYKAAASLDIKLYDHLIVSKSGILSFKQENILS